MEFCVNENNLNDHLMEKTISENSMTMSDVPQELLVESENSHAIDDVQVSSSNVVEAVSSTLCFGPNERNCLPRSRSVLSDYLFDYEGERKNDDSVSFKKEIAITINNVVYGNEISKDQLLFRIQQISSLAIRPTIADGVLYLIPSGDDSDLSTAISSSSESEYLAAESKVADDLYETNES